MTIIKNMGRIAKEDRGEVTRIRYEWIQGVSFL